jgi:hypothetical protein
MSDNTHKRMLRGEARSLVRICFLTDEHSLIVARSRARYRGIAAGGARRDRTDDLLLAKQALSQLSYGPLFSGKLKSKRPCANILPRFRERRLVGLGRFELPTSRLSSARSNQLSYRPNFVSERTRLPAHPKGRKGKGCSNDLGIAWARPRRKRNEDGEVPPTGMPILKLTYPDVFLRDPIEASGCSRLKDHP